jgi:hypothetical protein
MKEHDDEQVENSAKENEPIPIVMNDCSSKKKYRKFFYIIICFLIIYFTYLTFININAKDNKKSELNNIPESNQQNNVINHNATKIIDNNIIPNNIYYYSFCLYPESIQPSGTINFKYIKGKKYTVTFNQDFINEYNNLLSFLYSDNTNQGYVFKIFAKCYNLLIIHKGTANLLFNNY